MKHLGKKIKIRLNPQQNKFSGLIKMRSADMPLLNSYAREAWRHTQKPFFYPTGYPKPYTRTWDLNVEP